MPRKKNSSPVKGRISSVFMMNMGGSTSLATASEHTEKQLLAYCGRMPKKPLHLNLAPADIVLGHILLELREKDVSVDMDEDNNDALYIVHGPVHEDPPALKFYITAKNRPKVLLDLLIPDNAPVRVLLGKAYKWVLHSSDEGRLDIVIATTLKCLPILKAASIVEYFTKGDVDKGVEKVASDDSAKEFYEGVKAYQPSSAAYENIEVNVEQLLPKLRPYQIQAVQWMMSREREPPTPQAVDWLGEIAQQVQFPGAMLYYNKYSEVLSQESLDAQPLPALPRGGILADEMGLGKTVIVIALVLNHRREAPELDLPEAEGAPERVKSAALRRPSPATASRNLETSLSPKEKLLCDKAKKGPLLKRALTEWYDQMLAEYQVSTSPKKRARRGARRGVMCVCGGAASDPWCVQCPDCRYFQHESCVGYRPGHVYLCPSCWPRQPPVQSRGSLIVAPASISHQWVDEIKKHTRPDSLAGSVLLYTGVKDGFLQPSVLASHDIVLTTYDVLRADLNHTQDEPTRCRRSEKRFLRQSTPLTQVQWWRLCLDEAQMVEGPMLLTNQMARLLRAVNTWAVTGTPVHRSLQDLFYLLEYLRVEPFGDWHVWQSCLHQPFLHGRVAPLYSVMGSVFWRSSKAEVAADLNLPEQTVVKHWLKFTAIEQNFYMTEHAKSSANFAELLAKGKWNVEETFDRVDKASLSRLLGPLLNLRQACSHPMVVHGNKITTKTGNMTLTELLEYLCTKTKLDCEEGMRKHVAALNGLAGIHCIEEQWLEAADHYRQVLQFTEEYKDKVHIDSLQRIHTLTNLAEVLQFHPHGIAPTLRDDSLKSDARALEDKYLEKPMEELTKARGVAEKLSAAVKEQLSKFQTGPEVWWNRLLHSLTVSGHMDQVIDKINTEVSSVELERKSLLLVTSKLSTVRGVEVVIRTYLSGVETNRTKAVRRVDDLNTYSCGDLVDKAVECHLRTWSHDVKVHKCPLCLCESVLLDYECALFAMSRKKLRQEYEKVMDGVKTKGSWKRHNAEIAMKVILSFCKQKGVGDGFCIKDGAVHMGLLTALKKEFKQLRGVWMSLNHQVQAHDELAMARLRLRLRFPGEPLPPKTTSILSLKEHNKVESIYIIEHHEVQHQRFKLLAELQVSKSEFKKKFGTLMYLRNLGSSTPDPCPVCKSALVNEWCVLQCGHSYCLECIQSLFRRTSHNSVNCPVCRETTSGTSLSFVDLSGRQNNDINVVGDYSTKVDAIVRTALALKLEDPQVKILVFSSWVVALKVLRAALEENGVSTRQMPGYKYQENLREFRDPALNVTVLLLPLSWGSKGLNLVEATHVFLVEPIMNPAEELQAVGRVHRIGQTKETTVHRFLIEATIEEKIHWAVSGATDKWDKKKVTIGDLKDLFVMKNMQNRLGP